ncbi:hypothetical protein CLCOS_02630 [Clostridium coskatii]|uniref:Uncharacterized protein n=1 Tax=Clostridium coskatii TaxID=1705578 RepID=A0A166UPI0_9CLOT|nr:hypothetical protein WX73_01513 [Clostridium coskatii]OBR97548.1 hypothetical protein CLCOS_02630 [Clostridium coskatii]
MPLDFNFIENLIGLQDIKVTFVDANNGVVEIYAESKTHLVRIYLLLLEGIIINLFLWDKYHNSLQYP